MNARAMSLVQHAKQAHFAEDAANKLRRQCAELEARIKRETENREALYNAHVMACAEAISPEVAKLIGSSSTVAMKRKALEQQVLGEYPFTYDYDIAQTQADLIILEYQMRAARNDATLARMLFLAELTTSEAITPLVAKAAEGQYDFAQIVDTILDEVDHVEINAAFAAAAHDGVYDI